MSKHFHLRDELVMPPQQVFLKFRDDVHVHDFLYDHVDQDAMFEAMEEDNLFLYGDSSLVDDSDPDFEAPFEDGWPEDDYYPEEHYTMEALLGSDL